MLVDLTLAKVRDSGPNGARHQTGTMHFLANRSWLKLRRKIQPNPQIFRNVKHFYKDTAALRLQLSKIVLD